MRFSNEIKEIANFYGSKQLSQLSEECCELAVASNHFKRKRPGSREEILSEIADVEIMISQIKYLYGFEEKEVAQVKREKIERQLKRMESEEQ